MYCRNCGKEISNNAAICVGCGVPVGKGVRFCPNCGFETNPQAAVCGRCGFKLNGKSENKQVKRRDKTVAMILAILFGPYGICDFYLGYVKKGIIKIIAFLGGAVTVAVVAVQTFFGEIHRDRGITLLVIVLIVFIAVIVSCIIDIVRIAKGSKVDANGNELM